MAKQHIQSTTPSSSQQHAQVIAADASADDYVKPPLWRRILLPIFILTVAVVLAFAMFLLRPKPPASDPPPIAQLVETITAKSAPVNYTVQSQGTVQPRTETSIVSEVTGKIVKVSDSFVVGGFFNAGEVLLRIDPSDYQSALINAEANLASAEATLAEEQARSEQAIKDWENLSQVTGRQGREPSSLVLRKPQLAQAQASVRASEAALMQARRDLERTSISLPYAGIVKSSSANIGQFVSAGTSMGSAFAIDIAEVRLPLNDDQQSYLDLPLSGLQRETDDSAPAVQLSARVGNQIHTWQGRIVRTEGQVDEATRMIYAIAAVTDPYGRLGKTRTAPLTMGTFVQAEIAGISADNVVPLSRALLREDGTVLVVGENDKLSIRKVEVDRATAEIAYIKSGLNDGDLVVTTAVSNPIPGTPLRLMDQNQPNPDPGSENLAGSEALIPAASSAPDAETKGDPNPTQEKS